MKAIRAGAWIVLLILAGIQAWSARFYPTPDGVSYLDLSDAVLDGRFGELLNAYWSPMYPALIGLLRAVLRPSAYWDFAVAHLLNFLLFAASLAGYEYFISPLRRLGVEWGKPGLSTKWGLIGAYTLFGAFTLMMTPLILPTPDLLVSAASFFAFGALLRLRYDAESSRPASVLGVALAVGSLAKSFVIPWAVVCLVTAAWALRGRSLRPAVVAASIWLLAAVPWTIGLSMKTGHVTFGDTGRLTYVWYVNRIESPSGKHMPHAAATPATDAVLPGVAITRDAPGTNPVWYDPARWYSDLHPRFVLSRQLQVFGSLVAEYIASLAPVFLLVCFWLVAGGRTEAVDWWRRTWVVMVPSLAAVAAYSLVLVTTRYVAPFYVAMLLMVMAGARWPRRISPVRTAVGIGIPLLAMVATPSPGAAVALVNAAAGSVLFVWLARHRTVAVMVVAGILGAAVIRVLQPGSALPLVAGISALVVVGYWAAARRSEAAGEQELFSAVIRRGLIAANATLILLVAVLKYSDGLQQKGPNAGDPNHHWAVAHQPALAGLKEGERVAIVGSPFDAYWVRAARLRIVGVVPPPRLDGFAQLDARRRQALYDEFAKAGANYLVVQRQDLPGGNDGTWVWVPYVGWLKRLQ